MSVVIRETSVSGQESIYVLTKGAESAILPVSIQGPVDATKNAVDDFASAGLRTLVFAFKNITKEEFEDFAANLVSTL
jgi:magnesium-transporting ATPase (P-type)